jgi:hypothetical protein
MFLKADEDNKIFEPSNDNLYPLPFWGGGGGGRKKLSQGTWDGLDMLQEWRR